MGGFRWNLPVTSVSVFMMLNMDKGNINLERDLSGMLNDRSNRQVSRTNR